jgi:hypothetical protein
MTGKINIVALVAGVLSLVLVALSWFVPWWQFTIGNPGPQAIATVNFSPVNFNFSFFNTMLTVPMIWALNIASLLTLLAGGIALVVYAVIPQKSYSKQILGFGYKKPLYAVILFIIELLVLYFSATMISGISFPIMGQGVLSLPASLAPGGISISVAVSTAFGWTFFFAITVAVLCIVARFYHRKIDSKPATQVNLAAPQYQNMPPPPPPT